MVTPYSVRIVKELGRGLGLQVCAPHRATPGPVFHPSQIVMPYSDRILRTNDLRNPPPGEYVVQHSYGRSSDGKRWLPSQLSEYEVESMRLANDSAPDSYCMYYQDAGTHRWAGGFANHSDHSSAEIVHPDPDTALAPMVIRVRPSRTLQDFDPITVCYTARREPGAADDFRLGPNLPQGRTTFEGRPAANIYTFPLASQPKSAESLWLPCRGDAVGDTLRRPPQ